MFGLQLCNNYFFCFLLLSGWYASTWRDLLRLNSLYIWFCNLHCTKKKKIWKRKRYPLFLVDCLLCFLVETTTRQHVLLGSVSAKDIRAAYVDLYKKTQTKYSLRFREMGTFPQPSLILGGIRCMMKLGFTRGL